jgi:hypothetical protein
MVRVDNEAVKAQIVYILFTGNNAKSRFSQFLMLGEEGYFTGKLGTVE